ncbi:MAG TPA: DUF1501 domain-containing protein [Planctomycetaceae bacterium]|nr:DUF1501 domain-containing protein [Planctomycetaceae bacterium]
MLNIFGQASARNEFCDNLTRRKTLQVGALGAFGLGLPGLLSAENSHVHPAAASKKSVILVWMHGGPSQLDMYDMKPLAPKEYRGPFSPVRSNLPGLDVCELLPEHAKVMDKCTVIRSFSHGNGDHWAAAHWMLTGRLGSTGSDRKPRQPSMGAVASHLLGPTQRGSLASVNMNDGGFGFHGGAWLGVNYNPFRYGEFSYGNEAGRLPTGDHKSFSLVDGLSEKRMMNRVALQQQLDSVKKSVDRNRTFDQMDSVNQQALDIVLSGRVRKAFDVSEEPEPLRAKYGKGWGEQALLARRLIEAGVRYVSLNTGYFDDHGNIERALRDKLPRHDKAVGVLIQDLADRGMLDDTLVIVAGEFGHTPRINANAGRDHWPQAQSILLAGGGYKHGQVIGATNEKAEHPVSRKIGVEDFCATVYHSLGLRIDDEVIDMSGRPVHLVPGGQVPRELI